MWPNRWTFLTNHGHALLCIAADPAIRLRDVASKIGITERAAQRIVADLVEGGYLSTTRSGRRNVYTVNGLLPLRHPIEEQSQVAALLALVKPEEPPHQPLPSRARVGGRGTRTARV